jgi:LDH2 family malate/lactate/ureidoglycolate dehydrogenase
VVDFNADDSSETNTGHFIIVADIARFIGRETFDVEVERHVRDFKQSKRLPGADEIRLPGDRRRECRAERLRDGVPIAPALMAQLDKLAAELKVKPLRERK